MSLLPKADVPSRRAGACAAAPPAMKTPTAQTLWSARPAEVLARRERRGVVWRRKTKATQPGNRTGARPISAARGEDRLLQTPWPSAREWTEIFQAGRERKTGKGKGK